MNPKIVTDEFYRLSEDHGYDPTNMELIEYIRRMSELLDYSYLSIIGSY